MKAKRFITILDGKITGASERTYPVELTADQVEVTKDEMGIIEIVDGDIEYAKQILTDIIAKINSKKGSDK